MVVVTLTDKFVYIFKNRIINRLVPTISTLSTTNATLTCTTTTPTSSSSNTSSTTTTSTLLLLFLAGSQSEGPPAIAPKPQFLQGTQTLKPRKPKTPPRTSSTQSQSKGSESEDGGTFRNRSNTGGDKSKYSIEGAWLSERLRRWSNKPDVVGTIPVTTEFFLISCDSNQVLKWFGTHYNLEVPL